MKIKRLFAGLTLFVVFLFLSGCENKQAKIIYVGEYSDSVTNLLPAANISEYETWSNDNVYPHVNPKVPEILKVEFDGDEFVGKYSGRTYIKIPDNEPINEYEPIKNDKSFYSFYTSGNSNALMHILFDRETNEGELSAIELKHIADDYASRYIDVSKYKVRNLVTKTKTYPEVFIYYKEFKGVELYDYLWITLTKQGKIDALWNHTSSELENWYEKTSEHEKETFISTCTSDEVMESMHDKMKSFLTDKDAKTIYEIYEQKIIMTKDGKPAMYYELCLSGQYPNIYIGGLFDFLVVEEDIK